MKASLRSLPHVQAQLQDAEAACFAIQRTHLQQEQNDQAGMLNTEVAKQNTQAMQALQMLLLLLEFPKD